jgi:type 1 glutamine amidotransferase
MNMRMSTALLVLSGLLCQSGFLRAENNNAPAPTKVYGEWLIRPRPDKGAEYRKLIEQKGLPLFREAGGRMVGWWNTLVGDLYEQVTIWEYDDMAAFQKAVEFLGKNDRFAKFVALRDPLLTGENNRFLKLAPFAAQPKFPESAPYIIHEIHRVSLKNQEKYLELMKKEGLALLKKHGFRPVGPWIVGIGKWAEVTYLFRFESLSERDQLIARFSDHPDHQTYVRIMESVDEVTTRLLIPTPFAEPRTRIEKQPFSPLLPHLEQIAWSVYAAGFADRYHSANCGWVALNDQTLLIDLPRGVPVPAFLMEVARLTGKPVRKLVLTGFRPGDAAIMEALVKEGVNEIFTSPKIHDSLLAATKTIPAKMVKTFRQKAPIGDATISVDFIPLDGITNLGGAAVYLPQQQVLFAGTFVVNGPRANLAGTDSAEWIAALEGLEKLGAMRIVPGFGSWGGSSLVVRQKSFLGELRRQVGYFIAQGQPSSALASQIRMPENNLVWSPYDSPTAEDLDHVYREMTVPAAPFNGRFPVASDPQPHALVLIGDEPHEPGHLEDGLRPVFAATGVTAHFTVDVRALSAANLAKVQLLVILRDGLQRPHTGPRSNFVWMTPEQEKAVVQFVENGGGFLNLHNAMGLYPADGAYLKLVGGRYIGHGPLERFRVEIVDPDHAITRGLKPFSVADEQHTPPYDSEKVHLLLRNRSDDDKVAAAGWVYEPGKGRLCHLANGHTREALLHPTYQALLRNAVNWCLRRERAAAPNHKFSN